MSWLSACCRPGGGCGRYERCSIVVADVFGSFSDAISFIFEPQPGPRVAADDVGGLAEVWGFMWTQIWISVVALAIACAVAIPAGVYFGHRGTGEFLAVALGNAGRADPGADPDRVDGRFHRRGPRRGDDRAPHPRDPADSHQQLRGRPSGGPQCDRRRAWDGDDRARGDPQGRAAARGADADERGAHRRDRDRFHGDDRLARGRHDARRLHHQPGPLRRYGPARRGDSVLPCSPSSSSSCWPVCSAC